MVTKSQIDQLVKEIAEGYQPEKIYLFGSYANGIPTYDSDIDLFIVKDTGKRRKDRVVELIQSLKSYPETGVDFIIYTPQELKAVEGSVVNIAKEAVNTGKLLYERL
jgi:predicted nucleotidyltransferase